MTLHVDLERVRVAHKAIRAELLAERTGAEHWVGELAGSPLATAAAVSALVIAHQNDAGLAVCDLPVDDRQFHSQDILQGDLSELIVQSLHWLARQQNEDGGWGDATGARSNLAATMLVRAAFLLTGVPAKYDQLTERAERYIAAQEGVASLRRLAKDRFLAVPILTNCALAGLIPWRQVPALPFERACIPAGWHRTLGIAVPAHSIPLLVAVGQTKFHHDPPRNPALRLLRYATRSRSMAVAQSILTEQGGYLDTTHGTAFVVMSLASIGLQNHPVVSNGLEYLLSSMRADASWSIHANLATWNTTLAVNALADPHCTSRDAGSSAHESHQRATNGKSSPSIAAAWRETLRDDDTVVAAAHTSHNGADNDDDLRDPRCLDWLLNCQHKKSPSFGGHAGGWGWSDTPGALPNTDDTAGALLALCHWRQSAAASRADRVDLAARLGTEWLLAAQNQNGSWPMFGHGHGTAPLSQSACDLSAHALRALVAWQRRGKAGTSARSRDLATRHDRIVAAVQRGLEFLEIEQRGDGSFPALRFGNEHHPDGQNLVYGTSRVLQMCAQLDLLNTEMACRAARWLLTAQHACGGWGPPRTPLDYSNTYKKNGSQSWRANPALEKFCSVEESALAVDALLPLATTDEAYERAAQQGLQWLVNAVEQDRHRHPAVVGVHFTRLWYHERLYPLVFAAAAFERAVRHFDPAAVGGTVEIPVG